jgi:GPH family glycoside/pentoside/hexuronide:cation symporter
MTVLLVIGKFAGLMVIAVFICGALSKITSGAYYAWNVILFSNVAVYSEWKTGKNTTPFIMGLMSLPMKMGAFAAWGIIVPLALALGGFVSGTNPALADTALKSSVLNTFMLIPGLVTLLAFVILFFGYRLNNESVARYREEIGLRTEAKAI